MNFTNHKIGIWGTGIVGISALHFFKKEGALLAVYDNKPLTPTAQTLCEYYNARVYTSENLDLFLTECDYILPSAGINLKNYHPYKHKFLSEVDIFFSRYNNPILAVTGTIGKTTVSQALHSMLSAYGYRPQLGGNIGVGLFDLLEDQENYNYAVLELSSFQLESVEFFSPIIAVWTNLYPNHLDRHGTMHDYFLAKLPIIKNQTADNYALLHESVKPYLPLTLRQAQDERPLVVGEVESMRPKIIFFDNELPEALRTISELKTYPEHYRILYEVARLLGLDIQQMPAILERIESPEHRVTRIAQINGIDFYDDSKSTIPQATHGALTRFPERPVILFFGGVSKGVSRESFFKNLPANLKHIYLFGAEAGILKNYCPLTLSHSEHATLQEAFQACTQKMAPGDVVLFSPGGASFDLFKDYKERGRTFQELVKQWALTHQNLAHHLK